MIKCFCLLKTFEKSYTKFINLHKSIQRFSSAAIAIKWRHKFIHKGYPVTRPLSLSSSSGYKEERNYIALYVASVSQLFAFLNIEKSKDQIWWRRNCSLYQKCNRLFCYLFYGCTPKQWCIKSMKLKSTFSIDILMNEHLSNETFLFLSFMYWFPYGIAKRNSKVFKLIFLKSTFVLLKESE